MSTKASKKQQQGKAGTPQPSISPIARKPTSSPLSPTRYSRIQEKESLSNLNDRLACYIDKVRQLEADNSRLSREVQTSQEVVTREISLIKSMYDQELSEAKRLLDDTSHERAKLEIDTKRLWDDNEDLKSKLEKTKKDLAVAERNASMFENRFTELQNQCSQMSAENKKYAQENKDAEKELKRLRVQLDDARKHLEEETLARIDRENQVQSLKEDLSFRDQVHQQEIVEKRSKRQVEISEIDGRLSEQYEAKLQKTLQELRDQYEAQMRANREEIEGLYEAKIKSLTSQVQRNSGAVSSTIDDLRQTRARNETLNQRIAEQEAINADLKHKLRDLENSRENERARHSEDLAILEAELTRLRDEMSQQLKEYQDLMDIRIALDLEIAAYRKLLESEEARLNIVPAHPSGHGTPSRSTPIRMGKRKRTLLEESEEHSSSDFSVSSTTKCDIEISETDGEGRFVKLTNKGNQEISLSGWQLLRKAGELQTAYKFHRSTKIEAGGHISVWSSDSGAAHEPPFTLVMKGQKWFVADEMFTFLLNNDGQEMASSERKKQQISLSKQRRLGSSGELTDDSKAADKCAIM